ncbi:MAG: hypothetical protein IJY39_06630 [Clostridia bacterium]|nr:hypothetical protein [Clostridia bacterium]
MPRKPKPKNTLTAGERVALYEAEQEKHRQQLAGDVPKEEEGKADAEACFKPEKAVSNEKKVKPRPQHATVTVDFSIPAGEIKPMHGMCNGPVSYGADATELFREIGVPFVRFDGTDTAISAYAVDVSRIFRDFHADPALPENYDFAWTDKYVEAAYRAGARVLFRLGESYDMLCREKKAANCEDLSILSRVCGNIVKHYNDYWAGGFALGIEYFEAWYHDPEADGDGLRRELEVYASLANAVKLVDDSVKIGGMCFHSLDGAAREFVRFCHKNHIPLDFLTVSCFDSDPERVADGIGKMVTYAKNLGEDIEIIIGKWNYVSERALQGLSLKRVLEGSGEMNSACRRQMFEAQASIEGAAYDAALMLRLSAIPEVKLACFYDAQPMLSPWCALCNRFGDPQKPYYAFKAYGDLYRARQAVFCESNQIEGFSHTGIYAGAALSDRGEGYVLIASFGGCGVIDLRLEGIPDSLYSADVYMLDGVKDLVCAAPIPISGMKKRLLLNISEYGVVAVRLY